MENKCIYCKRESNKTIFSKSEHVIPKLFGVFGKNIENPTLKGYVCDICNSNFGKLENFVKEDTEEGVFFQMLNLNNSYQIRIRNDKTKTKFFLGFGDDFFNEFFPLFKIENNNLVIYLQPQIKLIKPSGYYYIFLIEKLKDAIKNPKELKKIKKIFNNIENKNIRIFTGADSAGDESCLEDAINLLNYLRKEKYREGKRRHSPIPKSEMPMFKINMDCTINKERGRIFAKIAFNYFMYCATKENKTEILYYNNFNRIIDFVNGNKKIPIKDIITNVDQKDYILYEEKEREQRFGAHQIVFYQENNYIVSEIIFIGRRIYKIILGEIPNELKKLNFGCGHLFNPFSKTIHGLTQNSDKIGIENKPKFGLFQRI